MSERDNGAHDIELHERFKAQLDKIQLARTKSTESNWLASQTLRWNLDRESQDVVGRALEDTIELATTVEESSWLNTLDEMGLSSEFILQVWDHKLEREVVRQQATEDSGVYLS